MEAAKTSAATKITTATLLPPPLTTPLTTTPSKTSVAGTAAFDHEGKCPNLLKREKRSLSFFLNTLLIPFGKFVFVTQRNRAAPLMPQQTSTFESHFFNP